MQRILRRAVPVSVEQAPHVALVEDIVELLEDVRPGDGQGNAEGDVLGVVVVTLPVLIDSLHGNDRNLARLYE